MTSLVWIAQKRTEHRGQLVLHGCLGLKEVIKVSVRLHLCRVFCKKNQFKFKFEFKFKFSVFIDYIRVVHLLLVVSKCVLVRLDRPHRLCLLWGFMDSTEE